MTFHSNAQIESILLNSGDALSVMAALLSFKSSVLMGRVFSRVLRDSSPRFVRRSVGRSPFYFFGIFERFELIAPAQMLQ